MSISIKPDLALEPTGVRVTDDTLSVDLADGRTNSVPIAWFPRLQNGTALERAKFELSPCGIHWPELNEDIPVDGLLKGEKSGESAKSIRPWLDLRSRGERETIPTLLLPAKFSNAQDGSV